MMWEMFLDMSYFDMWAVRRMDDVCFNSPLLFHVITREEAVRLVNLLNDLQGEHHE